MKIHKLRQLLIAIGLACASSASAQTYVTSTFKHITIDGSFADWTGVPLAYNAPPGSSNAIQYENVYIANDQTNIYLRFTLYAPRAAFANSYDNLFFDTDNDVVTGFQFAGIGSEMLIQGGSGYQETNGVFNAGGINNLGWAIASSSDTTDFEIAISLGATLAVDGSPVFGSGDTFALELEGDDTGYVNTEFVPTSGGLVYELATVPTPPTTNLALIDLTNSTWQANDAGTDLSTNWLDSTYDDTVSGWTSGTGLFGYTSSPASYPPIATTLSSSPNTYYFRTHFQWVNDTENVAFVVTNYLSDGAVYYLNGIEIDRVRMPAGAISYSTAASATNSPAGHADVLAIDGNILQYGDNILEVETHQAPGSGADMVFGLSFTAAIQYAVLNLDTNQPGDQTVLAGQPVTFTSDILGSGPLAYQWFFNGTNALAGANGPTYTIPVVLSSDAGTYSLQVSNSLGGVTTRAALLTVSNLPVSITSQPSSQVGVEGRTITFSVGVSGTPVISYQWLFDGSPIVGATNASYVISYPLPADAGSYQVVVSNPAGVTNSAVVNLSVALDKIPPALTGISAGATQITVTFAEPVDPTTATNAAKYFVSGGFSVVSAVQNPANPAQVMLTLGSAMNFATVYTLTVHGVLDLFRNASQVSGQFTRDIVIDGSFDDWTGLTPVYSTDSPTGNTNAADFKDIYVYNDADYYYFRVTLWADIDPASGQFPAFVNMFFDTDNDPTTGYFNIGSEMLIQSGYSYQEKNGGFNDGVSINGLNWLSLPASPGTNFEFRFSRAATFVDNTPVFTTNLINFMFQGQTPAFAFVNQAPPDGAISYTNIAPTATATLPVGNVGIAPLSGGKAAIVWDQPGILQSSTTLAPGSWTNITSATSPYVIPATGTNQFFRLTK